MKRYLSMIWLLAPMLAQPVWAVGSTLVELEATHELVLADVTLPLAVPGNLVFRACGGCAPSTLRITNQTALFVGKQAVAFAELRAEAERLRKQARPANSAGIFLFFDPASGNINRLILENFANR